MTTTMCALWRPKTERVKIQGNGCVAGAPNRELSKSELPNRNFAANCVVRGHRGECWKNLSRFDLRRVPRAGHSSFGMPLKKRGSRSALEILLVEDNPGDIRLMQEAFREAGCSTKLNVAHNGQQALAFLRRENPYQASPRPAFILLDLNLPGANGSELLAEIKKERDLRQIPVIVLSTSTRSEDIAKAYDLHANCYISKPADLEALVDVVHMIEAFWLGTAAAPEVSPRPQALVSRKSA